MKTKRILGLLLAVCVVLSAAPFAATEAAETGGITEVSTGDELREAIGAGGTVKMMADISGGLTVNTVATLDLNGFIFEGGVTINRQGVLTLTDSNPESLHDGLVYKDPTDGVTVHEVKGGVLLGGTVTVNRGQLIFLAGTLTASNGIYVNNGSVVMEGGLIAGNGSAHEFEAEDGTWNKHGPVVVSGAYATFTMKGGLITCNAYRDKSVLELQERADTGICVKNYATFTMQGGAITRNFFENGAGVFLMYDGVFNMEDGEISGNLARYGGAVGITSGTFNMTGGRIYDNTATESGGAVFTDGWLLKWFTEQEDDGYHIYTPVVKNINIKGGSIDHNQSGGSGGAILVNGMTSLEVSGGASITGNTAAGDGGGIDVSKATLTMGLDEIGVRTFDISHTVYLGDCNITGNTAGGKGGGIYLTELNSDPVIVSESENVTFHLPEAWLKIAGNTVIRNNLSGGAGAQKSDNVYLCEGAMILGDSDMTGAEVGVTTEEKPTRAKPVVFTKDLAGHGVFTNFISDDPAVGIWPTEDNEAMIGFFQYDIGIAGTENGSVSAVAEGYPALNGIEPTTTVTVTLAANIGYEIGTLAVRTYYSSVRITSLGNGRYSFKMPAADVEITATFNGQKYTVEFRNFDGKVLQSGEVEYGTTPEYTGSKPEKEGDAQYSYEFAGWSPEIVPVTGPATYTAVFTSTVNKYTVEFVDEGGNVLQSGEVEYGATPVYTGSKPVKQGNAQYSYEFAGWTPEIKAVDGKATYTAVFTPVVNKYTVEFVNWDGSVLQSEELEFGATPGYTGSKPEKEGDAQYSYEFAGWTPEIKAVDGKATYTAVFTPVVNKYTVEFVNWDGSVLQSEELEFGATPRYTGSKPEKEGDAQYSYEFAGWTPEIKAVDGKATYTAVFTPVVNKYTVEFVDEDGNVLQSGEVEYGATPEYTGSKPEKEGIAPYSYEFAGWTPEIKAVDGKATYTAVFTPVVNKYTVEFVDEGGNVLQSEELEFGVTPEYKGETPVKNADENNTYEFAGWSTEIKAVDGKATYTAVFNAIPKEPVNPPTGDAGLAVWAVLTVVTLAGTALFLDRNRKRAKAR